MNTRASVWYGWAFFTACGAGSYYFAKRRINADRHERQASENELRQRRNQQIAKATALDTQGGTGAGGGANQKQGMIGKSESGKTKEDEDTKFETKTPFRSKKGDRFS